MTKDTIKIYVNIALMMCTYYTDAYKKGQCMKILGQFVVSEVFEAPSGKVQTISLVDMGCGGIATLTLFNERMEVRPGLVVKADLEVKVTASQKYGQQLVFVGGTLTKI